MTNRQEYEAVDCASTAGEAEADRVQTLLQAVRWPRRGGLFANMASPEPRPSDAAAWYRFFTTARNRPLFYAIGANLKSGATVACVNVPLSISLALASGGTPTQGMICGLWSSLLVSILGGSQFNVVGATSALSGMMDVMAIKYGEDVLPTLAIYASMFLFVFWLLRVDRLMRYIATPVAHGFATGVGIMIGLGQLSSATGMRGLPAVGGFLPKITQFIGNLDHVSIPDAALYLGSMYVLFFLAFKWGKIPWVLVLAAVGIGIGIVSSTMASGTPPFLLLKEKFPEIRMSLALPAALPTWIPVIGAPPSATHCKAHQRKCLPEGPEMWQYQPDVVFYSFGCAVVSLLETLISAQIANRLLKPTAPDYDLLVRTYSSTRESLGLAVTAFVCGMAGAIAPAAALARSALNVKSGAFSRVSGFLNAFILAAIAFVLMPYFIYLPFSFVGSILGLVAFRLVDFNELGAIRKGDPAGFYLCILTGVVCLFMDTFAGLIVGTVASLAMNWSILKTLPTDVRTESHLYVEGGLHTVVTVNSAVTFANVAEMEGVLEQVLLDVLDAAADRYYSVHLDVSGCTEMDFDAIEVLDDWARKVNLTGAKLTIDRGIHLTRILSIAHNITVTKEEKVVKPTSPGDIAAYSHRGHRAGSHTGSISSSHHDDPRGSE